MPVNLITLLSQLSLTWLIRSDHSAVLSVGALIQGWLSFTCWRNRLSRSLYRSAVLSSGSTDTGLVKFHLLEQPLVTIAHSIISFLCVFTSVWVEIVTPSLLPVSAPWSVLALLHSLGSRRAAAEDERSRTEGGRGRFCRGSGSQGALSAAPESSRGQRARA